MAQGWALAGDVAASLPSVGPIQVGTREAANAATKLSPMPVRREQQRQDGAAEGMRVRSSGHRAEEEGSTSLKKQLARSSAGATDFSGAGNVPVIQVTALRGASYSDAAIGAAVSTPSEVRVVHSNAQTKRRLPSMGRGGWYGGEGLGPLRALPRGEISHERCRWQSSRQRLTLANRRTQAPARCALGRKTPTSANEPPRSDVGGYGSAVEDVTGKSSRGPGTTPSPERGLLPRARRAVADGALVLTEGNVSSLSGGPPLASREDDACYRSLTWRPMSRTRPGRVGVP